MVIKHSLRKITVEILRVINPGPGQLTTAAVSREHPPDAERPVNISISMNVACYVAVVDCECNRFAVNVIHS